MIRDTTKTAILRCIGVTTPVSESTIKDYILFLNRECSNTKIKIGTRCFLMATTLLKRLINDGTIVHLDNINDMIIISMIISFKISNGDNYGQIFYDIFGLDSDKLCICETNFLKKLGFDLSTNKSEYTQSITSVLVSL